MSKKTDTAKKAVEDHLKQTETRLDEILRRLRSRDADSGVTPVPQS